MKLRTKILSYTLPLILIPFLLMAIAVYYFVIRANQIQIHEQKKQRLNEAVVNFGKEIDSVKEDIQLLSNVPIIAEYLQSDVNTQEKETDQKNQAKTILELFFMQNPYYSKLSLVNNTGNEVIKFSKLPNDQELKSLKREDYFRRTLILGGIQTPAREIQTDKFAVVFTRSINRNEFLGMLVLTLNTEIFERSMRPLTKSDLVTFLFDDRGVILAEAFRSNKYKKSLNQKNLSENAKKMLTNPSMEAIQKDVVVENETYQLSFLPSESFSATGAFQRQDGSNWFLGVLQPKSETPIPLAFQAVFFSILLLAIGAVLFLTTKASSYITIPLEKVSIATSKISQGNTELELDIKTGDEVEDLANAVSRMNHDLLAYQKQIVQSAKLATMGEMTSEISHEIQNRISGISLWLQHLDAEIEKDDPRKEYLDEMKLGLNSFMQMLTDLKGYYKKPVLHISDVNINLLIDDALLFVGEKIKMKNIKIESSLQMTLPDIKGDKEKLKSVILNLLLNAIDSVDNKGKIKIKTDTSIQREKEQVILKISDNGKGIKEKDLSKIFYPFYSTKSSGSGLGLAISSNILSAHKGRIEVESKVGEGTTFTILLPAN